ncbi:MAG: hypothetical protein Q9198_009781, partial [Flavoplaca austrocitrina]
KLINEYWAKQNSRGSAGKSKATGKKRDRPSGSPPSPSTSPRVGPSAPKKQRASSSQEGS